MRSLAASTSNREQSFHHCHGYVIIDSFQFQEDDGKKRAAVKAFNSPVQMSEAQCRKVCQAKGDDEKKRPAVKAFNSPVQMSEAQMPEGPCSGLARL